MPNGNGTIQPNPDTLKGIEEYIKRKEQFETGERIIEKETLEIANRLAEEAEEDEKSQNALYSIGRDLASGGINTLKGMISVPAYAMQWLFMPLGIVKEYASAKLQGAPSAQESAKLRARFDENPSSLTPEEIHRMYQPSADQRVWDVLKGKRWAATYMELLTDLHLPTPLSVPLGIAGEIAEGFVFAPSLITKLTEAGKLAEGLTEAGRIIPRSEHLMRINMLKKLVEQRPLIAKALQTASEIGDKASKAVLFDQLRIADKAAQKMSMLDKFYKSRVAFEQAGKVLQPLGETLIERGIRGQVAPIQYSIAGAKIELKSPAFYKGLDWLYSKLVTAPEDLTKAGTMAEIRKLNRGVIQIFKRTTFIPELDKSYTKYVDKLNFLTGERTADIEEIAKIRKVLGKNIYDDLSKTAEKVTSRQAEEIANELISNFGEARIAESIPTEATRLSILDDLRNKLSPEAVAKAQQAGEVSKDIGKWALKIEQQAGVDIKGLPGNLDYIVRFTTPEAQKIYNNMSPAIIGRVRSAYSTWHRSMMPREASAGMMLTEWNKAVYAGKIKGMEAWKGIKFFETDPVVQAHITVERAANAAAKQEFIRNVTRAEGKGGFAKAVVDLSDEKTIRNLLIENPTYSFYIPDNRKLRLFPGRLIPDKIIQDINTAGMAELTDEMLKNIGTVGVATRRGIKAYLMPKDAAKEMTRAIGSVNTLPPAQIIWKYFDSSMDWLRAQYLLAPSFHVRNVLGGNMPNMILDGVNPKNMITGRKLQTGANVTIISPAGKVYRTQDILNLADRYSIRHTGFIASEAVPNSIKDMYRTSLNPLQRNWILFQINRKIGTWVEDGDRLAVFADSLEKGLEPSRAALRVEKTLFTYDPKKIPISYRWVKRVLLFPRWYLSNLWFQMGKAFMDNPRAYRIYENIIQGTGKAFGAVPTDIDTVPDWVLEETGIPVAYKEGKRQYFVLGNYFSPAELKTLERFPAEFFRALNPVAKALIEQNMGKGGYSFFFERPIERYAGETGTWMGIPLRQKTIYFLRNIRALNEIDRLFFRELEKEKGERAGITARALRTLLGFSVYPVREAKLKKAKLYERRLEESYKKKALRKRQSLEMPKETVEETEEE
jgi:hypothetical protein